MCPDCDPRTPEESFRENMFAGSVVFLVFVLCTVFKFYREVSPDNVRNNSARMAAIHDHGRRVHPSARSNESSAQTDHEIRFNDEPDNDVGSE